jgi:hypothetical protein
VGIIKDIGNENKKRGALNCTPKVGRYNILKNFGGAVLCRKETRIRGSLSKQW